MRIPPGYEYLARPSGWFQIAYSHELGPGDVKPLRYFGQDLVIYRGESGDVHVLDAFCGHLGAHLGHGGRVCGDDVQCPFHGWRWDCEGRNVNIPHSDRVNRSRRIRPWQVREGSGTIFLWHDATGAAPTYDPPAVPEADDPGYYPLSAALAKKYTVKACAQSIIENTVDALHFEFVHLAGGPSTIETFSADGPVFHVLHRQTFGLEREGPTWLTPDGPVEGAVDIDIFGVGMLVARFWGTDDAAHYVGITPIDAETTELRSCVIVRRKPGDDGDVPDGVALKRVEHQHRQGERDIPIWDNQTYQPHPPFSLAEAKVYGAFRRWSRQFYPEAIRTPDDEPVDEWAEPISPGLP
jgi:3-ketosteroid 9alpha-monooxygenase subunit A